MGGRYGRESAQMEDKSKQRKEERRWETDDNFQSASRKSAAVKVEKQKRVAHYAARNGKPTMEKSCQTQNADPCAAILNRDAAAMMKRSKNIEKIK
jgi:hypothetical protein